MEWFIKIFLTTFTWLCFVMLYALFGMILWNYVMPVIFNLPKVEWFEMLCLMILANIIIKGFNITYTKTTNK